MQQWLIGFSHILLKAPTPTRHTCNISEIIKHRRLTQVQFTELLKLNQAKSIDLLRGQFRGTSEAQVLDCLSTLVKVWRE